MNFQQRRNADLNFGFKNEADFLPIMREVIDPLLARTTTKIYYPFDYMSPNTYVELKSRKMARNVYPTFMIGENKIRHSIKTDKEVFFVWNFYDEYYVYKFNKDDIDNGGITFDDNGGRRDRGVDETKRCAFVNAELATRYEKD